MKFAVPARVTRIRRFGAPDRLPLARGWIVLDEGCGLSVTGPHVYRLAGGEGVKRWDEAARILEWLAARGAERSQPLIAIGGGAVLDLAALVASLYRRGMPLTLVPTTLLAMVDATLGGKTAVDGEIEGRLRKNFAGTFYPAHEVWLCLAFLRTLPARERLSGAGEVYKTMWIRGRAWNVRALEAFVASGQVGAGLAALVNECLRVKGRLVERDPLDEKRVRELLNFGHTVGHALESGAGGRLSHGECVLWGMAVETALLGAVARSQALACAAALRGLELPAELARVREDEWVRLLGGDKKTRDGKIEMSLLRAPGRGVRKKFTPAQVARAIREFRL